MPSPESEVPKNTQGGALMILEKFENWRLLLPPRRRILSTGLVSTEKKGMEKQSVRLCKLLSSRMHR